MVKLPLLDGGVRSPPVQLSPVRAAPANKKARLASCRTTLHVRVLIPAPGFDCRWWRLVLLCRLPTLSRGIKYASSDSSTSTLNRRAPDRRSGIYREATSNESAEKNGTRRSLLTRV